VVLRGGHVVAAAPSTDLAGDDGAARYRALLGAVATPPSS